MSAIELKPNELRTLLCSSAAALANAIANDVLDRDQILEVIARLHAFAVRLPDVAEKPKRPESDEDSLAREVKKGMN